MRACAVAYVTERALQTRYPCRALSMGISDVEIPDDALVMNPSVFSTHYSSVEIGEADTVAASRLASPKRRKFTVITVGTLAQVYKGMDILIDAVARCVAAGADISLVIIGDGKHRVELEAQATSAGIADRVRFAGTVPSGAPVRGELDRADLFVLASRTEGLPRAIVEAMARALPCIATTVGGIPELLCSEDMVPPNDPAALAAKIHEVLSDPGRMTRMSARNLEKAKEYRQDSLDRRRHAFYAHVRRITEKWIETGTAE